jgi:hypothetical protein
MQPEVSKNGLEPASISIEDADNLPTQPSAIPSSILLSSEIEETQIIPQSLDKVDEGKEQPLPDIADKAKHPLSQIAQSASLIQQRPNLSHKLHSLHGKQRQIVLATLLISLVLIVTMVTLAWIIDNPSANIVGKSTPIPINVPSITPLGALREDFTTKLGKPVESYANHAIYQGTSQKIDIQVFILEATGQDKQNHAIVVRIAPKEGTTWTTSQAMTILGQFLPTDAIYQQDKEVGGNMYHIFKSELLKNTFSSTTFTTLSHKPSDPGKFVAFCSPLLSYCILDLKVPD